jgi:hypothetical protein
MKPFFSRWAVFALFVSLQFPALRDLYKFLPKEYYPLSHAFLLISFLVYFYFIEGISKDRDLPNKIVDSIDSRYVFLFLACMLILLVAFVYPLVDGMKYYGRGSDQDDSIINAGLALLKTGNPYTATTYFSFTEKSLSPGPGWIIISLPFTVLNAYFVFSPFVVIGMALLIKWHSKHWATANLFIIFLLSTIIFWDLLVEGSDLIALGCFFSATLLVLYYAKLTRLNILAFSIVIGMLATSRIAFSYIPVLYAVLLYTRDRKAAFIVALFGTLTMFSLHYYYYLWSIIDGHEYYKPLHLIAKGSQFMPGNFKVVALIACSAAGVAIIYMLKNSLQRWLMCFWLGLYMPMLFVSLGALIFKRNMDVTLWEGANYLTIPLPAFLVYILISQKRLHN